jgi:hypothetical protein
MLTGRMINLGPWYVKFGASRLPLNGIDPERGGQLVGCSQGS